jgi:hypothetical protein
MSNRICVMVPKAVYSKSEQRRLGATIKYNESIEKEKDEDHHQLIVR